MGFGSVFPHPPYSLGPPALVFGGGLRSVLPGQGVSRAVCRLSLPLVFFFFFKNVFFADLFAPLPWAGVGSPAMVLPCGILALLTPP